MGGLQRLLVVSCPVLLFFVGVIRLLHYMTSDWAQRLTSTIQMWTPVTSVVTWWLMMIAIPVCILALFFDRHLRAEILTLKTDSGRVIKIRQSAVNNYIQNRLSRLPQVRGSRVRSCSRQGELFARVRVWVMCGESLDNVQEKVFEEVTRSARAGFGMSKIAVPDLQFESIKMTNSSDASDADKFAASPRRPSGGGLGLFKREPAAAADSEGEN